MVEGRERVSAAVILIIFLVAAVFVYLIMLPEPVTYSLIYGNFSNQTTSTNTSGQTPIADSFYYPITSYIGGNPSVQNFSYSLGSFGVSYHTYNSTISGSAPFKLKSSIFSSASYNMRFRGNSSDTYFLELNISSVSGSPKLKVALNGDYFYTAIPAAGEKIALELPQVLNGNNTISVYNYLNGFALTQSIGFSSVSITQKYSVSVSHSVKENISTLSGLGNFYLQFTPIGTGNLSVSINGQDLTSVSSGHDNSISVMIPSNIVNAAVSASTSPFVPVSFDTTFSVSGQNSSYEIANGNIIYVESAIPPQGITIPYSVNKTTGEYVLTFYVNTIMKEGNVSFQFSPSGRIFHIAPSSLVVGQNTLILPLSTFSGETSNGNYTGTVYVSSSGLIIPQYLDIKATS